MDLKAQLVGAARSPWTWVGAAGVVIVGLMLSRQQAGGGDGGTTWMPNPTLSTAPEPDPTGGVAGLLPLLNDLPTGVWDITLPGGGGVSFVPAPPLETTTPTTPVTPTTPTTPLDPIVTIPERQEPPSAPKPILSPLPAPPVQTYPAPAPTTPPTTPVQTVARTLQQFFNALGYKGRTPNSTGKWTARTPHVGEAGSQWITLNNGMGLWTRYQPDKDVHRWGTSTHDNAVSSWNRVMQWTEEIMARRPDLDAGQVLLVQIGRLKRNAREQGIPLSQLGFQGIENVPEAHGKTEFGL